jgi:hypothetical protein
MRVLAHFAATDRGSRRGAGEPTGATRYVLLRSDARPPRLIEFTASDSRGGEMKTIHTVLREDFGRLDRNLVRSELLSQNGVTGVSFESARNGLSIEYDPTIIDSSTLVEIMCRYGVYPEPISPRTMY